MAEIIFLFLILLSFILVRSIEYCISPTFQNCTKCFIAENSIHLSGCLHGTCQDFESPMNDETQQKLYQFEKELTEIFQLHSNVLYFTMTNMVLKKLPSAICSLKNILEIHVENSCIKSFPNNCINKLKSLKKLLFPNNKIEFLQSGLFDGMRNLESIELTSNEITHIEDDVFSNETDLLSLTNLDLSYNSLKNVDAWIFIRGISVNSATINLRSNKIHLITNRKKWFYICEDYRKKRPNFHISLYKNKIEHISDILIFFPTFEDAVCFLGLKSPTPLNLEFDGNALKCDCVDYKFIQIGKDNPGLSMFDGVHCQSPLRLMHERIISVPLDVYQCELTPCPNGCLCTEIPLYNSIYVNCSSQQLQTLPTTLPVKTNLNHLNYHYNLTLNHNAITSIENRSYLSNTTVLDLSHNKIDQLDLQTLMSLDRIEELYLHSNLLSTLPMKFLQNSSTNLHVISLHDNPWDCSCENKWLKSWMMGLKDKKIDLLNQNSVLCKTPARLFGKNIYSVDDDEFCNDPQKTKRDQILMGVLIPMSIVTLFSISMYFIIRRFKVWLNTHLNIHPLDRDECSGEHMEYDAFVSCAYADRERAIEMVNMLESRGYKVCYHEKDFVPGKPVTSNILEAVLFSKRVLCLMTLDFINSPYCLFEFQISLHRNIEIKKKRLIVLMDGSVKVDQCSLPTDLYNFLSSHTYIELSNKNWVHQLFYSLPLNPSIKKMYQMKELPSTYFSQQRKFFGS